MTRILVAILACSVWLKSHGSSLHEPNFETQNSSHWVITVTQPGCRYCERLEQEVLQPLRASQLFDSKVRFTTVSIATGVRIKDFNGKIIDSIDFASRYSEAGTPTVLFLNSQGAILAEPIFGLPDAIDYYAYYLEETIRSLPQP